MAAMTKSFTDEPFYLEIVLRSLMLYASLIAAFLFPESCWPLPYGAIALFCTVCWVRMEQSAEIMLKGIQIHIISFYQQGMYGANS